MKNISELKELFSTGARPDGDDFSALIEACFREVGLEDLLEKVGKEYVDNAVAKKASTEKTYTKEEVDNAVAKKASTEKTYTKEEVDNIVAKKASTEKTYTKEEVDNAVDTASKTVGGKVESLETLVESLSDKLQELENSLGE